METRYIHGGIELHFPAEEREAAQVVERACERSISVILEAWGLAPPNRCRVYVMTSWLRFVLQSAPWHARLAFALLLPFWCFPVRKLWKSSGGWTQAYRRCPAMGVKPPRLIAETDQSIGEMIFVKEPDLNKKMEHVTCNEMTHVCSAALSLPLWLDEGIAMITVGWGTPAAGRGSRDGRRGRGSARLLCARR
jgi:hypothetical protein